MKLAVFLFSAVSLVTVSAWAQTSPPAPAPTPDTQATPATPAPDTQKTVHKKVRPKHAARHTHLHRHHSRQAASSGFGRKMETTFSKGLHVLTDGTRHARLRHESYRKYSASCKAGLTNRYGYLRGTATNHVAPC